MSVREPLRRWLLVASLVVAAALVVGAFNPAPHSGGDNAAYLSLAHALVEGEGYVDAYDPVGARHTKYPPLFPLLLAGLAAAGAATWTAFKALVAVATVAGVGFTFLWAERRLGPWRAFSVAVLVAASAGVVYYSHWVLSEPVFVVLTLASLWALERGEAKQWDRRWIAFGAAAALAAYFTRSAGLPLLVAVLAWLGLRRRFRELTAVAAAFAVPALVWLWWGRGAGVGDYTTEFWLADPYQPGLGTVGLAGLAGRALENGVAYAIRHVPAAVVGSQGVWTIALGVVLVGAALFGWASKVRREPGAAELFVPLYVGLILLWPEVWGGDRFVLPVLPLVFLYGSEALEQTTQRLGGGARVVAAAVLVGLLLPALGSWAGASRDARACSAAIASGGPFACYGTRVTEFVAAAGWMGVELPEGAAVMTRKPRIFYVMSGGVPSRTFPFDPDPRVLLAEADEVGARYVLLDRWDGQAGRFVGEAVRARPGAFCFVRGFGPGPAGASQLLGILPSEQRTAGDVDDQGGVALGRCPESWVRESSAGASYASPLSTRIPLFSLRTP
ncbi:MAG: hypothetical protein WD995_08250 [Gemmatimonadota bacterium]